MLLSWRPWMDLPPRKAGLQPGDVILDVNDQPVTGLEETVDSIRGPAGTSVTIETR